jgi:predicted transcriptional regulator of viral defense system
MQSSDISTSKGREQLSAVLKAATEFISVDIVVTTLSLSRYEAARLLARWAKQGLLRRIRRGLYVPVSLHDLGSEQVLEDPWLLVPEIFGPGYIGGWSAAEHWGLTEQIFREICVLTTKPIRSREWDLQGIHFKVKRIKDNRLFGLCPVWRRQTKVMISSPERTLVDMLDDPSLGGGIRHVLDCLNAYLSSDKSNPPLLIDLARQLGNGAVFKRLGFLIAQNPECEFLVGECLKKLSGSRAKLDPSLVCERLVTKWRLWVPDSWKGKDR